MEEKWLTFGLDQPVFQGTPMDPQEWDVERYSDVWEHRQPKDNLRNCGPKESSSSGRLVRATFPEH